MCGKAPFHFEPGLQQFEACSPHVCVPSNWCNFDLRKEIEGFIATYVMTQKYNGALFSFSARQFLLFNCQSIHASVPAPLVILYVFTPTGTLYKALEDKNLRGD